MNITFANITGTQTLIIPVVPPDGVEINIGANNETQETVNGNIRLTGSTNLTDISWSSFFPVNKNYPFCAPGYDTNGYTYIDFIESALEYEVPIRVVVTNTEKYSIINKLFTIDSFKYTHDKVGDIKYSISLTEFNRDIWEYLNSSIKAQSYALTRGIYSSSDLGKYGLI